MTVTAIPTTPETEKKAAEEPKRGSKKKMIVIILAVVLLGGGGYWQFFRPKPVAPPKPGEVVALDPIQINLAGEHYLRVGIALQLTSKAKEADGSKALDAAIDEFSGREITEVTNPKKRRELKKELAHELEELYEDEVMGVYFTEFVTQ